MPTPLEDLNAKIFREQLHSQFKVHQDNAAPITLELVDVVENDLSPKMELFSLHFRGPFRPRLASRHIAWNMKSWASLKSSSRQSQRTSRTAPCMKRCSIASVNHNGRRKDNASARAGIRRRVSAEGVMAARASRNWRRCRGRPEQKQQFVRMQYEAQKNHYAAQHPHASHEIICLEGDAAGRLYLDRSARNFTSLISRCCRNIATGAPAPFCWARSWRKRKKQANRSASLWKHSILHCGSSSGSALRRSSKRAFICYCNAQAETDKVHIPCAVL